MRILLVEDEPDAAQMIAKGLREHAYAVDAVADGVAACYQAAVADYDRVLERGQEVPLTAREYALLEYLAWRGGQVVGRTEIAEHVWDERYEPFSNVIEVYVRRLRRKLDDPSSESLIRTRRGEGYELSGPRDDRS